MVNPLLRPLGALFISNLVEGGGGLIEIGGLLERGHLFNLEKIMVSVLHKKTRIESGNAQVQEV